MSLLNNMVRLRFFANREFNRLYLAIFMMTCGESLINIFVPIYLYQQGFAMYQILFFYCLVSLYFVVLAVPAAKVVSRIGDKYAMLLSTPLLVGYYLGLLFVSTYGSLFFVLPLCLAASTSLFNTAFHLNFLAHSRQKKRGHELALFGMGTLLATVLAPYLGGVLAGINFALVFVVGSGLIVVGSFPLLIKKGKAIGVTFGGMAVLRSIFAKKNVGNIVSFSGYAIESVIGRTVWPVYLIILVGSVQKTGILISASLLLSFLGFYVVGLLTDRFNRVTLLRWGTVVYCLGWIARIFVDTVGKVLLVDTYKNLSEKVLHIPWTTHSYDIAKRANYFEFIVGREIIYNAVRVLMFPVLISVFWINFHPFIVSFVVASIATLGYVFIDS